MSGLPISNRDPAPIPLPDIPALIERIDHGIVIFDALLNVRYANRRGAELFAHARKAAPTPDDLSGRNLHADFPEMTGEGWVHACREVQETGAAGVYEYFHMPGACWYECRIYPCGGEILLYAADITGRKTREAVIELQAEKYRNLVETAHGLIWSVDEAGRITFINQAAREIYGYEPEELIGRDFRELLAPEERARQEAIFAAQPNPDDRYVFREEVEVMHRSGERRFLLANAVRLFDEDGRPAGFMGTSVDVTERIRARAALENSRRQLQALYDNALDAFLLTDDRGCYIDANPAACEMLGYSRDELLGLSVFDVTPSADHDQARKAWQAFIATGQMSGEFTMRRKDGTHFSTDFRATAHILPGIHLSVVRDITDRKRINAALISTENLLQTILANVPISIFATDREGRFTFSEGQGLTRAGLGQGQNVGLSSLDLYGRLDVRVDTGEFISGGEAIRRALSGETVKGFAEVYGVHYECQMGPLRNADGEIVGIVGVSADVTDRHRAETDLNEAHENLRALANRVRELQEAERRAITAELHDRIGQNLSGLGIRLQRLNGMLSEEQKTALAGEFDVLQGLVEETTRHVRDIMAELVPPELEDLGLAAALESLAERAAATGGLALDVALPDLPPPPLPADLALVLFRAAQEAVHNAIKHSGASLLTIRLSDRDGMIRLEMADDGRGFDPQAPPENGSLAWGLKILRERIASIDGDLAVESRPGAGTRIAISVRRPA